jgi:hypothetical protein
MRFDTPYRAALVLSLGVIVVGGVAAYYLLQLFFAALTGPPQTGYEKEVISSTALYVASGLLGVLAAFFSFRPILALIRERGLPGLIEAPDPFAGKQLRVALTVLETGSWREVYSQWLAAPHVVSLLRGDSGSRLTLGNQAGERLTISRELLTYDESGDVKETFVVKLKHGKKVVHNLEMPAGLRGTLEVDSQKNYATCWYPLACVGCDDKKESAWLKFGGKTVLMRQLFRRG